MFRQFLSRVLNYRGSNIQRKRTGILSFGSPGSGSPASGGLSSRGLRLEALEDRTLLSVTPGSADLADTSFSTVAPAWFQAPDAAIVEAFSSSSLPDLSELALNPAFDTGPLDARSSEWVVRLSETAMEDVHSVDDAAVLLQEANPGVSVERGLGLPGQLLITVSGGDSGSAETWLEESVLFSYFEPNVVQYSTASVPDDSQFDQQWGMHNTGQTGGTTDADIDAPEAWDMWNGSSDVVVGVIDSGVDYTHEDLAANMWINPGEVAGNGIDDDGNGFVDDIHGWDFAYGDNDPMDVRSHGTHCAGVIAATSDNGVGVSGINWSGSIMALKFLDDTGRGSGADAVSCVNYATMMRTQYGVNVRVLSNSWGGGGYEQGLYDAIAASRDADILFVASAGNAGTDNDTDIHYPSNYDIDNVISVAATDHDDNLAYFSNYGATTVDLAAPGVDIYSTVPGSFYVAKSGTSMAAPHVAGVAALAASLTPDANYEDVRDALFNGVDATASLAGNTVTGGRLNAAGTLDIISADPVTLTLPVAAAEGDGVLPGQGSVSIPTAAGEDLVVALTTEDPSEISVPSQVIIPAGATSASFDVTVLDDSELDGAQSVRVIAGSTGYSRGAATILVTDNDSATLGGTVWRDMDGDGQEDPEDPLLSNRHVFLDMDGNGTFDSTTAEFPYGGSPLAITDYSTTDSQIVVSGFDGTVSDVNVTVDIDHTYDEDLAVTLEAPDGTEITLFYRVGGSGDGFDGTTLDDQATIPISQGSAPFSGIYQPQQSLSTFNGTAPNGTWTLHVTDLNEGDTGSLNDWSLEITAAEPIATTNVDGEYSFSLLEPGTYDVRQNLPPNWTSTFPSSGCYSVTVGGGDMRPDLDFGTYYQDQTAPSVLYTTPGDNSLVYGDTFDVDVAFSEEVTGVDASDLQLGGSAAASAIVETPVALGGNVWRFPISGLESGTLNLTLAPSPGAIQDLAGNDLLTVNWTCQVDTSFLFFDDFSSATFDPANWSNSGDAVIDETGLSEPSAPYAARLNAHPNGGDSIESVVLDMSAMNAGELYYSFQQTGGGDSPEEGDDLTVSYRAVSGNWVELDRQAGDGPDMTSFEERVVVLPDAAFHDAFQLRFSTLGTSSSTNIFDDWFIDNIAISAREEAVTAPASFPFVEDFSSGTLPAGPWEYYSTGTGRIQVVSEALRMDSSVDQTYGLNEAVLHVDLSHSTEVSLLFDHENPSGDDEFHSDGLSAGDVFTEPHRNADLVAFSDDGIQWCVLTLLDSSGSFVYDLTSAVADAGMTLSSNFQIKFQQYDNYAWSTDGREFDNIMLSPGVPGLTVTPSTGLVTTEAGQAADFTVVLDSAPASDVTVSLTSSDATEGTVSPATLTFTPSNWDVPQTVTVTGQDDDDLDLDTTYAISFEVASADASYDAMALDDLSIVNEDDETVTITLLLTANISEGETATGMIMIDTAPTVDVSIPLESSDPNELSVPANVTILAGQMTADFDVTGVIDTVLDDTLDVTVSAEFEDWTGSSDVISVVDNTLAITTPAALPTGYLEIPYDVTLEGRGGTTPYTWRTSGGEYEETAVASGYLGGGTAQGWQADDSYWNLNLPWTFSFYGQDYDHVYVSSNGLIDFGSGSSDYSNSTSELISRTRIAAFWDDLDTNSGDVYVTTAADHVIVRWDAVRHNTSNVADVEVVLYQTGEIQFNYGNMGTAFTPTVGISAGNGIDYLLASLDGESTVPAGTSLRFAEGGALPAGLTLDPATGTLSGAPTEAGTHEFSVLMDDSDPNTPTVSGTFALEVLALPSLTLDVPVEANEDVASVTGSVQIPAPLTEDLVVTLLSDDTTEAVVPATVTILAGETTADFAITIVDDGTLDNVQTVTIGASAAGYNDHGVLLDVMDTDRPTLHAEPQTTPGTYNTVSWDTLPAAEEYFVEVDDDPAFGSPNADSGWITETSYQFSQLAMGENYYYRVKARQMLDSGGDATWSQTTQGDFEDGDNGGSGTSTVSSAGDVVLAGGGEGLFVVYDIGSDNLVSVDSDGNVTELPSAGGDLPISGLAYDSCDEIVYATSSGDTLWSFELNTGLATELGTLPLTISYGLAYNPLDDLLYSVTSDGDLVQINPNTLNATVVNSNGLSTGAGGGAFNPIDGRLYFHSNGTPRIYSYDAVSFAGPTAHVDPSNSYHYGMAHNGETLVIGGGVSGSGGTLYSYDPTTGATAPLFSSSLLDSVNLDSLTFIPSGYTDSGEFISEPITIDGSSTWNTVEFNATVPAGTTLTVDVLPETGDQPIAGYEDVGSGTSLTGLAGRTVRLRATLATSDEEMTPVLHDWTVGWNVPSTYYESVFSEPEQSEQIRIVGDLDGDGVVGSQDLDVVRARWGDTVPPGSIVDGDPSGDGRVGSADLDIVRANWGAGIQPGAVDDVVKDAGDGATVGIRAMPVGSTDVASQARTDAALADWNPTAEKWRSALDALASNLYERD